MKSIGIDLAGKEENPTGFSILKKPTIEAEILYSDEEIIETCNSEDPNIVAIDAPLSFPVEGSLRKADSELIKRGYKVLPPSSGGMKLLTERGISLAKELKESDFEVIEVHPRTSARILFDSESREEWVSGLSEKNWDLNLELDEHQIDSALAALTGHYYLKGKVEEVGENNRKIVIPQI